MKKNKRTVVIPANPSLDTAQQLFQNGQPAAAIKVLEGLLKKAKTEQEKIRIISLGATFESDPVAKEVIYKQLLKKDPNNPELLKQYAKFLLEVGRGSEAEKLLEQSVAAATTSQAEQKTVAKKTKSDLKHGKTVAIKRSFKAPSVTANSAALLLLTHNNVMAAEKLVTSVPNGTPKQNAKNKLILSTIRNSQGNQVAAKELAEDAITLNPSRQAFESLHAASVNSVASDAAATDTIFSKVTQVLAANPTAQVKLGILGSLRRMAKQNQGRTVSVLRSLGADGQPAAVVQEATWMLLTATPDMTERTAIAKKLFDAGQKNPDRFIYLAKILVNSQTVSGSAILQKALATLPNDKIAAVLLFLGTNAASNNDHTDAENYFQQGLSKSAAGSEVQGKLLTQLAGSYGSSGRINDALATYEKHYTQTAFAERFRVKAILDALTLVATEGDHKQLLGLKAQVAKLVGTISDPSEILFASRQLLFASQRLHDKDLLQLSEQLLTKGGAVIMPAIAKVGSDSASFKLVLEYIRRLTDHGRSEEVVKIFDTIGQEKALGLGQDSTALSEFISYVILALTRTKRVSDAINLGTLALKSPDLQAEGTSWITGALGRAYLAAKDIQKAKETFTRATLDAPSSRQTLISYYWLAVIAKKNADIATQKQMATLLKNNAEREFGKKSVFEIKSDILLDNTVGRARTTVIDKPRKIAEASITKDLLDVP